MIASIGFIIAQAIAPALVEQAAKTVRCHMKTRADERLSETERDHEAQRQGWYEERQRLKKRLRRAKKRLKKGEPVVNPD